MSRKLVSFGSSPVFTLLFGRRLKTAESETQQVGPVQGVPILGLDALGSSSYGPEAALTILIPVGAAGLWYMREVVLAILILLGILYFSYRQTIAAYPTGGGSYSIASENMGTRIEEPGSAGGPVPRLKVIHSPYRQLFKPLLAYVDEVALEDPECLIAIVIPDLVEPRWWEYLLHNHIATMLKAMLFLRGDERVVILSTPCFLHEA